MAVLVGHGIPELFLMRVGSRITWHDPIRQPAGKFLVRPTFRLMIGGRFRRWVKT